MVEFKDIFTHVPSDTILGNEHRGTDNVAPQKTNNMKPLNQ